MFFRIFWAVVLGLACGGDSRDYEKVAFDPCVPRAVIPKSASPSEEESLKAALDMWNRALGSKWQRLESAEGQTLPLEFQNAAGAFFGLYDDERGIVFINHSLENPSERAITIVHELGHSFGLAHVSSSERASVMNPANRTVAPTPEDVAAVVRRWGVCGASSDRSKAD